MTKQTERLCFQSFFFVWRGIFDTARGRWGKCRIPIQTNRIELDECSGVTFQDVRLSIDSKNNACIKIKEAPIICVCPCVKNVFDCYTPLGSMSKRYQHLRSLGTLDISGFNCRSSTIFKFQPCSEATAATCPAHNAHSNWCSPPSSACTVSFRTVSFAETRRTCKSRCTIPIL